MKLPSLRDVGTEARLLLIGIPVFIWTMLPIYHMFLFAISPKEDAFAGKFWPDHPTLHNFHIVFYQQHYFLRDFWIQFWNSIVIAVSAGALTLLIATAAAFAISRLTDAGYLYREPIGIFRQVERATYDDQARAQIDAARDAAPGEPEDRLAALIGGGDTWTVV